MNPKTTIQLQFPVDGGTWTDVTHLVRDGSQEHFSAAMNAERRSVVDSYSFALKHDQTITDKFHSSSGKIFCTVDEYGGSRVFTGWIAPTATQHIGEVVEGLSLEALDMTYPLDERLAESFQYPATVGGTAYKVLDSGDAANSIVLNLLEMAGYTIATDVSPSCPDVLDTIQSVAGEQGEETYRELLDDLLYEVGYALSADAYGRFTIVAWDRDTVTPVKTLSSFGVRERLRIQRVNREEDGFEVEWSELAVMNDALLYRENLPISSTAGEAAFTGTAIAAGDYFPPDSDIKDIFQRFRTEWLDRPYLARETRLRNPDLSLVNTSGHVTSITADSGVAVSAETYEAHRSQVNIRNTSGGTAKLYTFEIHGDALYRTDIRETLVPSGSTNPERYRSRFVFSEAHADRLAVAGSRLIRFGNYNYEFELREDLEPGEIYRVYQERDNLTAIDTTVVILERRKRPDRPMRKYVAQAITAYSPETTVVVGSGGINRVAEDARREAQEENTPSFADIDGGYDSDSGGTTTPTAPVLAASSAAKSIVLEWDRQISLTNLDHYEVQVSDDAGVSWYSLDFAGLGTGTVDTMTSWPNELLVHPRLPLDGSVDSPTAKDFSYRVRRVTKKSDLSAWSNEAAAQSLPVSQGDLAADSVYANNIRAGVLEAMVANINDSLTISDTLGYLASGDDIDGATRAYLDPDEIVLEKNLSGDWVNQIRLGSVDAPGDANAFIGGTLRTNSLKLFSSSTEGAWSSLVTNPFGTTWIRTLTDGGGVLLATANDGKISRSVDGGASWSSLISNPFGSSHIWIVEYGNGVFFAVADDEKISRSTDGGLTWSSLISNPLGLASLRGLAYGDGVFVMSGGGDIARSADGGVTWSGRILTPFGATSIYSIAFGDGVFVATGDLGQIIRSTDGGLTWSSLISNPFGTSNVWVAYGGDVFIAWTDDEKIARSTDGGQTWSALISNPFGTGYTPRGFAYSHEEWIGVGENGGISRSTDGGATWSSLIINSHGTSEVRAIVFVSDDYNVGRWLAAGELGKISRSPETGYIPLASAVYPIGSFYVQYPDADSSTDSVSHPTSTRPATLFGGTWEEQWSTESIFFRTRGSLADSGRSSGLQTDALQGHHHNMTGNGATSFSSGSLRVVHPGNGGSYTSAAIQGGKAHSGYVWVVAAETDSTYGTLRVASETRASNRIIKVWKRTA